MPTDKVMAVMSGVLELPIRFWRYSCEPCGYVWANTLQRAHNEVEYRRAVAAQEPTGLWI